MTANSPASKSVAAAPPPVVQVGQTDAGSVIRIEGRGTMRQSAAVNEFISRLLGAEVGSVVVDLSACTYLDSTFLGCLLDLHKRFGTTRPPRFSIAASPSLARKLFGPTCLDKVLNTMANSPPVNGPWHALSTESGDAREVARHVMECHRVLAGIEGPNQAAFARIADQMARDMERGSG